MSKFLARARSLPRLIQTLPLGRFVIIEGILATMVVMLRRRATEAMAISEKLGNVAWDSQTFGPGSADRFNDMMGSAYRAQWHGEALQRWSWVVAIVALIVAWLRFGAQTDKHHAGSPL